MFLDRLERYLPPKDRVALRAVGAKFPPVNVCVAVRAVPANVRKHRLHMALGAGDFLVHPAQRVSRLVVIEFRYRADRAPAGVGMTILTGNGECTVRTSSALPLCTSRGSVCWSPEQQYDPKENLDPGTQKVPPQKSLDSLNRPGGKLVVSKSGLRTPLHTTVRKVKNGTCLEWTDLLSGC